VVASKSSTIVQATTVVDVYAVISARPVCVPSTLLRHNCLPIISELKIAALAVKLIDVPDTAAGVNVADSAIPNASP